MTLSRSPSQNAIVRTVLFLPLFVLALTSFTQACLWDWDTLQMERRRFPGVLEMITGKFVRHSPAYYEWRIRDRNKRMSNPADSPELADDVAVALLKLGRHSEAIALLEKVLEKQPDRYETLANLGTTEMLIGDLKSGKQTIDRAIEINPDAHFGREKYQSLLADYFLNAKEKLHPMALSSMSIRPKGQYIGFAKFVLEKKHLDQNLGNSYDAINEELATAQKGVLGMMHFANYDSPLLLEALGDLLVAWPSFEKDALHLAARAYYRVSMLSDDENVKKQFKEAARNAVFGNLDYANFRDSEKGENQTQRDDLEKLSSDLERELEDARIFVAKIADDEKRWIAEDVDVDAAFARKYYDSLDDTIEAAKKQLSTERRDVRGNPFQPDPVKVILAIGLVTAVLVGLVAGSYFAIRKFARKRSAPIDH